MVYTIYETNCIVFDIKNLGENDCLIKAFSDQFGIISIIATSFRKTHSKLRGNIKSFSINQLSTVKGREFFRLTDTKHIFSFSGSKSLVNFLRFIEDLFWGDERDYFDIVNKQIYDFIVYLCKFIINIVKSDIENKRDLLNNINILFAVYIRGLQGFIDKIDIDEILKMNDVELIDYIDKNKKILNEKLSKVSI